MVCNNFAISRTRKIDRVVQPSKSKHLVGVVGAGVKREDGTGVPNLDSVIVRSRNEKMRGRIGAPGELSDPRRVRFMRALDDFAAFDSRIPLMNNARSVA